MLILKGKMHISFFQLGLEIEGRNNKNNPFFFSQDIGLIKIYAIPLMQ